MRNIIGQIALLHLYIIVFLAIEIYKSHNLVRHTVLIDVHPLFGKEILPMIVHRSIANGDVQVMYK